MKQFLKGAVVLLIAIAMVFSSVAIADTQTKETIPELSTTHSGSANGARGDVVWDNGMDYDGLGASQEDTEYPLSFMCADDFHFEEDTEVCDVHWVGGYWNDVTYNQVHWPWRITFYYDDGSGERPGNVYIGPFDFDSTQYTETLLEDTGSTVYYEFGVDLPENYMFYACYKYWVVIQGVGFFPPQSGWGLHQDPITLHEAVFKGEALGFPDWTDSFDVFGYSADMCFQLTTKEECDPCIDIEKYVWDKWNQEWVDADTQNEALEVGICNDITFKIVIHNCGDIELNNIIISDKMSDSLKFISGDPEPDELRYEEPYWYMYWFFPGPLYPCETIEIYVTAHVEGPECSYDFNYVLVEAYGCENTVVDEDYCWVHEHGRAREFNNPILNFLQNHPNIFPMLQLLLQRLGLF